MLTDDHDGTTTFRAFSPYPRLRGGNDGSRAACIPPQGRRMGVLPPLRSQPVREPETIASLIAVAAVLLDTELGGAAFSLEQLMKKMRELLEPGRTVAVDDVRAALPAMGHCLAAVHERWRWRRREAA